IYDIIAKRSQALKHYRANLASMKKKVDDNALLKVIEQQQQTIEKLYQQNEQLQHRLDKLLQLLYGTKSEKKKSASKPDTPLKSSENKSPSKTTSKNKNGRRSLPADL